MLQIAQCMSARAADLGWLSQYASAGEYVFPPGTALEVERGRVEGSVTLHEWLTARSDAGSAVDTSEKDTRCDTRYAFAIAWHCNAGTHQQHVYVTCSVIAMIVISAQVMVADSVAYWWTRAKHVDSMKGHALADSPERERGRPLPRVPVRTPCFATHVCIGGVDTRS